MGKQDQFSVDTATACDDVANAKGIDASIYITALLDELHSIAYTSGLNQLSDDIQGVLSKHSNIEVHG
jgi:hypothetical protein